MTDEEIKLYKQAYYLSLFTIIFNLAEGLASVYFGYEDETLTLFGFGLDSFVEVISAIGVFVMIKRVSKHPESDTHKFEKTALKITGYSFYLLSIGLLGAAVSNIITHHKHETTLSGIIISLISFSAMTWLAINKRRIGKKLNSAAIIADGKCTQVCIYMSLVLLVSSLLYQLTKIAFMDVIGTLGIIYYSFSEGKEALE